MMTRDQEQQEAHRKAHLSSFVAEQIKPLLANLGPDVQGAVLADLVALFLAGHHPATRDEFAGMWWELAQNLVPVAEAQLGDPWKDTRQ